jgi:hypothetical protein
LLKVQRVTNPARKTTPMEEVMREQKMTTRALKTK